MKDLRSAVLGNDEVARDFFRIRLEAPAIAEQARPGQFVEIHVNDSTAPFLRLPLSISAADTGRGTVELLYEDVGPKTHALSRVRAGDRIACMGPLGRGFGPPAPGHRAVLVGGGIGVPPLLFWGNVLLRTADAEVVLLVGAREAAKHLPDGMLANAAGRFERATDDGGLGHKGLVTELLEHELARGGGCEVFTCGPHGMMAAVAAVCRRAAVPCQASLEEYMACGYGVCVGCVVEVRPENGESGSPYAKYSRVCVDGPVFDAHRVCWGNDG